MSEVTVTRKQPQSSGGRKIRTQLNFLDVITEGNESQNIRLFDGDTVVVSRSDIELREQIIKAGQTNLSPDFVEVYVTGRVRDPGSIVLPQGATLDQALAAAGGQNYYVDKLNSYASTATVVPISANSFYVRRTPQALSKPSTNGRGRSAGQRITFECHCECARRNYSSSSGYLFGL